MKRTKTNKKPKTFKGIMPDFFAEQPNIEGQELEDCARTQCYEKVFERFIDNQEFAFLVKYTDATHLLVESKSSLLSPIKRTVRVTASIQDLDITVYLGKIIYLEKVKGKILGIQYSLGGPGTALAVVDGYGLQQRRRELRLQRNEMTEVIRRLERN